MDRGAARILERLLNRLGAGELGRKLASGASWVFGQKLYLVVTTLGVQILLSRSLGPQTYGAYVYALAWTQLLALPALMGLDRIVTRELAASRTQDPDSAPWRLLKWSVLIVVIASASMATLVLGGSTLLERLTGNITNEMRVALWAGTPLIAVLALLRLRQGILLGRDRTEISQSGEMVVMPTVFLLIVGAVRGLGWSIGATHALAFQSISAVVALIFIEYHATRGLGKTVSDQESFNARRHLRSGRDLVAMSITRSANTRFDILILGVMLGAGATGIYSVANRGAGIMLQAQISIGLSLAPVLVRLSTENNYARIQRLTRKSSRINFVISLGMALILVLLGRTFLGLFGPEFVAGYAPLLVLGFGQVVVSLFGASQMLLVMTGHERDSAIGAALGLIAMVVLNVLMIPIYGMIGAAWATAIAQVTTAALLAWFCWKRLKVLPTATGPISRELERKDTGKT
jgi:O-antigen/teichoic acid export membrane protein